MSDFLHLRNVHATFLLLFLGFGLLPSRAATLFTVNRIALDGSAGENTFVGGTSLALPTTASLGAGPTLTFNSHNGILVSYFDPVSLTNIGDTITFSFTARFSNFDASSNGFRLGLFNSEPGSKITSNLSAITNSSFTNCTGYIATNRATGNTANGLLIQRSSNSSLMTTASPTETLADAMPAFNITNGNTFSGSFSIARTAADELTLTNRFQGLADVVNLDRGSIVTKFDTIGFFTSRIANGSTTQLDFTEFTIRFEAIPEPQTFVLLTFGIVGVVLSARGRGASPPTCSQNGHLAKL